MPIPAASACVTALAASGQPTARFVFEGFLPVPKRDRRERLTFLQNETRTMIFYEAPHKAARHPLMILLPRSARTARYPLP